MYRHFRRWWPIAVVVVGAAWAVFTYFDDKRTEVEPTTAEAAPVAPARPNVAADRGSVAIGGDNIGSDTKVERAP